MGEPANQVNIYNQKPAVNQTDDTAAIRGNIENTRAEMSETIEAIQERLNPQTLREQAKEQVREQYEEVKAAVRDATIGKAETMARNVSDTVSETRNSVMDTIRDNPIPTALVGIGLGWLFMNGRSSSSSQGNRANEGSYRNRYTGDQSYSGRYAEGRSDYATRTYGTGAHVYDESGTVQRGQQAVSDNVQRAQDKVGDVANRVQGTVSDLADRGQETVGSIVSQTQETVGNIVSQTQETVGSIADQAQYQAHRVEDRFQRALHENPLAVGAAALAVGAVVGLAAPQTRRENELMGEARDNLLERAQEVAQDTMERVQHVAGEAVDQAQTTAKEEADKQGLTNS